MPNYLRANFLRKLKPNLSSLSATITTANSAKYNINNKSTLFLTDSLKPKLFNNNKNNFTTFSKISSLNINNFKSSPFNIKQFSTTAQNLSNAAADKDLAAKLKEEIKYEKENESLEKQPEFIKEFLDNNPFKIEDKAGSNEVKLTRTFGNEKIRLLFDISLNENPSEQLDFPEDEEGGVESEHTDDDLDDDDDVSDGSIATRCNIIIEKDDHGALGFETLVSDGIFIINYVTHYKDAKLSYDWSAEADWKRRGHYPGPQFETLDNEIQVLFEKYLEERGIDTAVALFIQSYVEYKDQREYVNWLKKVEKFVDTP